MAVAYELQHEYCKLVVALPSKNKKKKTLLQQVNLSVLKQLNSKSAEVDICFVQLEEVELDRQSKLDEMWSFVGKKVNQR